MIMIMMIISVIMIIMITVIMVIIIKMAIILPTGQWYAPSAVINDAW